MVQAKLHPGFPQHGNYRALIFFFIVVHMWQFFVPYRVTGTIGIEGHEAVAEEVAEAMANPMYAALYLISVIILAFHISHGFASAWQSLGLNNKSIRQF